MNIVLTSGVALGAHVPGMLVHRAFTARGRPSKVYVLERLFPGSVQRRIQAAKDRYSGDYRLAKAAHALATDHRDLIPADAVSALFDEWDAGDVGSIIVISGFWAGIVAAYVSQRPGVRVDLCHLDAGPSPSYRRDVPVPAGAHSWLLDGRANTVREGIFLEGDGVELPWDARPAGFLSHGGGWGMGRHASAAVALAEAGAPVSLIITGQPPSPPQPLPALRLFRQEPQWEAWSQTGFPPLVPEDGGSPFPSRKRWHDAFELTRQACAVISKPGAGTLVDSLNAATPVLFTEALGDWELANERVWCSSGFGMRLSDWMRDRDRAVLEAMHRRLRAARRGTASYPDRLMSLCS